MDSLQNTLDKIETIGESEPKTRRDNRYRHSSECTRFGSVPFESGGGGLRGFKFHEEFFNFFDGRQLFFSSNSDNASKRKSDSDVVGANASVIPPNPEASSIRESSVEKSFFEQGSNFLSKVSAAPKKTLRLSSPFSSFPSTTLASSSVIPSATAAAAASSSLATSKSDENDQKNSSAKKPSNPSPYTFFTMESDDDFDFNNDNNDDKSCLDDDYDVDVAALKFSLNGMDDQKSTISQSSSTLSLPVCRICQLPSIEPNNHLISPCRCLGSIRYVHNNCLLKWLEVSSKRRNGPPCCELCQYQYLRHKKFVISHWRFPECSLKDKILHFFFVISVLLMIACAAVTIICFKEDRGPYRSPNKYHAGELSPPELITLSCGVLFFLAFFLAMYVEVKARHTVYQLICKFFYLNHEWSVEEYDRKRDLITTQKKKKEKVKKKRQQQQQTNANPS